MLIKVLHNVPTLGKFVLEFETMYVLPLRNEGIFREDFFIPKKIEKSMSCTHFRHGLDCFFIR